MKKLIVLVVLVAIALSACASGNFLGFLATNQYVDTKTKELADQQALQIAEPESGARGKQGAHRAGEGGRGPGNETQKTIADLQALAKRAEARIASIPKDVIKQIIDIAAGVAG